MAVDDSYTKSLLHFDGSDGSTTFTDESGKSWTRYGNAELDTASKKFGTASGLFDGNGDYINTPDNDDWCPEGGDFTVDFWVKRASINARMGLCMQSDGGAGVSFSLEFSSGNAIYVIMRSSGSAYEITSSSTLTDTTSFHHIALVRYGNTATLYLDGTSVGTANLTGVTIKNVTGNFTIGRYGDYNDLFFNGWIDEFRYSKGIARWTGNFTPQSSAYGEASTPSYRPRAIWF
jgi:hypothetical protein